MHESRKNDTSGAYPHGGERGGHSQFNVKPLGSQESVQTKCTQVCGGFTSHGKSCAKIVLVNVYEKTQPCQRLRIYAIIDEQSNRSLASPALFEKLGLSGEQTDYSLNSCLGMSNVQGRKVSNCMIETIDGSCKYLLPPLLECSQIPNARDEIPTSQIATQFGHLKGIASKIPPLDEKAEILLLIGRDLIAAHHVHEQITSPKNEPFAQRLGLGWVIVGQVCLGQIHQDKVNCMKTYLLPNGRESLFPPCSNNFKVTERIPSLADDVFVKTKQDNQISMSVEDREFVDIMSNKMVKDPSGNLVAPLPFASDRPKLPNNRSLALKRAHMLQTSLRKNPQKLGHFLDFMDGIISKGHSEIAPPIANDQECWYLPLFGVYHPKKPDQIRGVFDASAKFENLSLNDVLLQGPDLINSLLGILLRFRKDKIAICADIQQMFYSFLVKEEDRDFLRFFWYKENDPNKEIIEYRMRVHVFGNKPSPSVANFGLQKTAAISETEFGKDVKEFISQNFYVDDGLVSLPTVEQTVDLMKRTQAALLQNGNLRLHKIASSDERVLKAFPPGDLTKDISCLDLSKDDLLTQRSLGLLWVLKSDCFTFSVPDVERPFTQRGVLSVVNSLYDPLGFVAPVTIVDKLLLRSMTSGNCSWDEPLPDEYFQKWLDWTDSLKSLKDVSISRGYFGHSLSQASNNTLLLFSDASEKAIASVAYLVSETVENSKTQIGFVMGKTKVAPTKGHTIPRLELCAAVLSAEIAEQVLAQLQVHVNEVRYFTDSKVVLGYIYNRKRRFYTYVANRVERILNSSKFSQWYYIDTKHNPADIGSRGASPSQMSDCMWLKGPPEKIFVKMNQSSEHFCLHNPDQDKEVRPDVTCMATRSMEGHSSLDPKYLQKFSSFRRLTKTVSNLQHVCKSLNKSCECVGWHLCPEASSAENVESAQCLIFRTFQKESYPKEIDCLKSWRKAKKLKIANPRKKPYHRPW
ncbi:uncharacterized protein LOC128245732 [Mya arenaria]|uniref:uncharacterized protein LOC128245732 n=1 Tax=Mya arenaria TaxID=6604 RepID=UPI0022E0DC33|nr:uncharacterized protein LOC128245732 [Mya arenaria]